MIMLQRPTQCSLVAMFMLILVSIGAVSPISAGQTLRIATYNIRNLNEQVAQQGDRLIKLRQVIELLQADIIGLQEVASRSALHLLFSPSDWEVVIDDDSASRQDVAVVVRKPLRVLGIDEDLDAEDDNFLFPLRVDDVAFPGRRDVLRVDVELAGGAEIFVVLVHHGKARVGKRSENEFRRKRASMKLVQAIREQLKGRKVVLLCDCNDTPDDASSNILETGNPAAGLKMEELAGPFLINLAEALQARDEVSFGRKSNELSDDGKRVITRDPSSRKRNFEAHGTNDNTGDILFDHIYVSPKMFETYREKSIKIFDHAVAAIGNDEDRASDHLPVFADFRLGN